MKDSLRNYTALILRRKWKSPSTEPGPPGGTLPKIIVYILGVFFFKDWMFLQCSRLTQFCLCAEVVDCLFWSL